MPGSTFKLDRTLAAPRAKVWAAFSEQDRLQQWFSPKGMTMHAADLDLRVGGHFHYGLTAPGGMDIWGMWRFIDIVPEAKLHFLMTFSNAEGGLGHHPMAPDWPQKTMSTIIFNNVSLAETTVTVQWAAHEATPTGQALFDSGHDSMRMGWTGTFDHLAAYLANPTA